MIVGFLFVLMLCVLFGWHCEYKQDDVGKREMMVAELLNGGFEGLSMELRRRRRVQVGWGLRC